MELVVFEGGDGLEISWQASIVGVIADSKGRHSVSSGCVVSSAVHEREVDGEAAELELIEKVGEGDDVNNISESPLTREAGLVRKRCDTHRDVSASRGEKDDLIAGVDVVGGSK